MFFAALEVFCPQECRLSLVIREVGLLQAATLSHLPAGPRDGRTTTYSVLPSEPACLLGKAGPCWARELPPALQYAGRPQRHVHLWTAAGQVDRKPAFLAHQRSQQSQGDAIRYAEAIWCVVVCCARGQSEDGEQPRSCNACSIGSGPERDHNDTKGELLVGMRGGELSRASSLG